MRQLVRILVKVLPNSHDMFAEEDGGGNQVCGVVRSLAGWRAVRVRPLCSSPVFVPCVPNTRVFANTQVNKGQIQTYLANTLGEMAEPPWGLPLGWGSYIAALFTWVLGLSAEHAITQEQAINCARRPQGRSWESVDDQIRKLGECWSSVVRCSFGVRAVDDTM